MPTFNIPFPQSLNPSKGYGENSHRQPTLVSTLAGAGAAGHGRRQLPPPALHSPCLRLSLQVRLLLDMGADPNAFGAECTGNPKRDLRKRNELLKEKHDQVTPELWVGWVRIGRLPTAVAAIRKRHLNCHLIGGCTC